MNCACHGEPCYWEWDKRKPKGGYWRCAVKKRAHARVIDARRRDVKNAQQRDRYDNDPIHRIEKRLKQDAVQRRRTIERRRTALATEHGGI